MSSSHSAKGSLDTAPAVQPRAALPRLHRSPVPRHEPREASRVARWESHAQPPTQGTLALALPNVFESLGPGSGYGAEQPPGSQSVGLLPEPNAWASTFVQAAMEVAGGLRSAGQLVRWTTPEVHALLARRSALTSRTWRGGGAVVGVKPRLRALLSCSPRPGVCEVSAVIAEPGRVRAIALRMEGMHGRWRVTELQIG